MAVELTQGYLSVAVAMEQNPGRELGKWLDEAQQQATKTGQGMGKALTAGIEGGAAAVKAESARIRREMEATASAAKAAREKEEAAARKVQIAEAKLAEARESGKAKASQLLALEDRLATAKKAEGKASLEAVAAEKKAADAYEEAEKAITREADALKDLSREADKAGDKAQGFGRKLASGLKTKLTTNPFKAMERQAGDAGADAGRKFSTQMQSRIRAGASKIDLKSMMAGAAGGVAAMGVSAVGGALSGVLGDAASQSDSTQKFAQGLQFAQVNAKAIQALTKSTQDYADRTVYNLGDIRNTTAGFAANGVKNAGQLTEALGNLNAVGGGTSETFTSLASASVQTLAAGKLTTENWNQIRDAVPGASAAIQKELSAAIQKELKQAGAFTGDFAKALETGQISADEYKKAISNLGMQDAAKQAAASTATFEGAWGGLRASITGQLAIILDKVKPAATEAMTWLADKLPAALQVAGDAFEFVGRHKDVFGAIAVGVGAMAAAFGAYRLVSIATATAQAALNAVMAANPIGLVVLALVGLTAGLVYAWKHSETFRRVVTAAWTGIKDAAVGAWNWTRDKVLVPMGTWFTVTIPAAGRTMGTWFASTWQGMQTKAGAVWGWVRDNALTPMKNFFTVTIPSAGRSMLTAVAGAWDSISRKSSGVWKSVRDNVLTPLKDFFTVTIPDAADKAQSGLGSAWDKIKNAAGRPVRFVLETVYEGGLKAAFDKIPGVPALPSVKGWYSKLPGRRFGGVIDGQFDPRHRDNVLAYSAAAGMPVARVEPGEMVTNRESTRRSMGLLGAINRGTIDDSIFDHLPVHAGGGVVGGRGSWTARFAQLVQAAASKLGIVMQIAKRGFLPDSGISGTSHRGDAIDAYGPGNLWSLRDALRSVGIASWVRGPKQGFEWHVHGVPMGPGFGQGGGSAIYQAADYAAGGNGLRGMGQPDPYAGVDRRAVTMMIKGGLAAILGGGGAPVVPPEETNFWDKFKGMASKVAGMGRQFGPWGDIIGGPAKNMLDKLKGYATGAIEKVRGAVNAVVHSGNLDDLLASLTTGSNGYWPGDNAQLAAVRNIVNKESGFNPKADNPNSTAYGLFQLLYRPGTSIPYDQQNPEQQIRDGLSYIRGRYGNPVKAWDFWRSHHWYDQGGYLPTGQSAVMNRTGQVEPVFTNPQWQAIDQLAGAGAVTLSQLLDNGLSLSGGRSGGPVAISGELTLNEDGTAWIEGVVLDTLAQAAADDSRRSVYA